MPGAPGAGQVVVKWIASPVNPLDLNKISGTYPAHSAQFPCIGGSEAVGFIDKVRFTFIAFRYGDIFYDMPKGQVNT